MTTENNTEETKPAPHPAKRVMARLSLPLILIAVLIVLNISTGGFYRVTLINGAYDGEVKNYSIQEAASNLLKLLNDDKSLDGYKLAFINPNNKKGSLEFSGLKTKEDLIEILRHKMGYVITDNPENRILILEN